MLTALALASMVASQPPADSDSGLPIRGVTVNQSMPRGVTHIEAPPFRAYRMQTPGATGSPTPAPKKR